MNAAAAAAVDFKNGFGTQFNGLMQPFTDTDSLYSTAYTSYNNWATKVRIFFFSYTNAVYNTFLYGNRSKYKKKMTAASTAIDFTRYMLCVILAHFI